MSGEYPALELKISPLEFSETPVAIVANAVRSLHKIPRNMTRVNAIDRCDHTMRHHDRHGQFFSIEITSASSVGA